MEYILDINLEEFDISEIESIELVGEEETIDIEVEDTHMFFANDIYTHNSGSSEGVGSIMSIGKAIEPFQVADMLMMLNQPPELEAEKKLILTLLKNRLGPKNIVLECSYDPNLGTFDEIREVPELLRLSNKDKNQVRETISNLRNDIRNKLQVKDILPKK